MSTIYLAGGCFWGLQKFFDQFGGVIRTEVGYANGPDKAPSYQEVCRNSGHAETVLVEYDDKEMTGREMISEFSIGPVYITLTRDSFQPSGRSLKDSRKRLENPSRFQLSRYEISSLQRSTTRNIWIRIQEVIAIFLDLSFPSQTRIDNKVFPKSPHRSAAS